MNAPDKIYLTPILVKGCGKSLSKRVTENDAVYIREDLIKAEIERQLAEHKDWSSFYHSRGKHSDFEKGAIFALNRMLHFIDNLCGEKSARQRLAEWSKTPEGRESYEKVAEEMRRGAEEGEALEKEIGSYMSNKWKFGCVTPITPVVLPNFTTEDLKECARHFADWQKVQYHFFHEAWADNMQYQLDRNYENGKQAMREQMMKEAVKMYPCYDEEHNLVGFSTDYEAECAYGQLTRIIIVKED